MMSEDKNGLAEELKGQLAHAYHRSLQEPLASLDDASGNGNRPRNAVVLPGTNGNGLAPKVSLSAMSVLDQGAYPSLVDGGATEDWRLRDGVERRQRLSRLRDLSEEPVRGPMLRFAAVVGPISLVLLASSTGLTTFKFLGLLVLFTGVWLTMQHAATVSARLSPFAVGVWAPSMVGAVNGAIASAAICLMLQGLGVGFPQILLMFAGVFTLSCIAEALSLRLSRRRRLLLVGASDGATDLLRDLSATPKLPFEWIGVVTDEMPADTSFPIPVLGTLADLPRIVPRSRPDLVVVADLDQRDQAVDHLVGMANMGFRIVGLPEIYEYALGRVPVRHLPRAWFMSLLHLYQRPYSRLVARSFDLSLAVIGMVLAAPLFALIAALVRCSGRGSVFFGQERVGEAGRLFKLIKFRTMIDGAENGEAVWAAEGDSRITRVGRFLRATRLDELPQLWNVVRNEMSIIGPRPERPEFLELLEREVPFWARRLLIKPGITGWAQVKGGYASGTVGAADKLSYDLYYLKHRGMLLNFAIVAKTAVTVVTRSGAR
jgi:exopolysaccharide biosynthesis polyprenyl glycosylphosphotransferase